MSGRVLTKYREKRDKFLRGHNICSWCLQRINGDDGVIERDLNLLFHRGACFRGVLTLFVTEDNRKRPVTEWKRLVYEHRESVSAHSRAESV